MHGADGFSRFVNYRKKLTGRPSPNPKLHFSRFANKNLESPLRICHSGHVIWTVFSGLQKVIGLLDKLPQILTIIHRVITNTLLSSR